jgi:hypothetical protein
MTSATAVIHIVRAAPIDTLELQNISEKSLHAGPLGHESRPASQLALFRCSNELERL